MPQKVRVEPVTATVMKLKTRGPTARTRRMKKARSKTVGRRLNSDQSWTKPRGVTVEKAGRRNAPRSVAPTFGTREANNPSPARATKYARAVVDLMRQPKATTQLTINTTGQAKTHTRSRK